MLTSENDNLAATKPIRAGYMLYENMRRQITKLSPHAPIDSGRRLASQYGVSMVTVRSTLARMVDEGLIYVKNRHGYFVAPTKEKRAGTIVYLDSWNDPDRPYVMRVMRGMVEESARRGYSLEVASYGQNKDSELAQRSDVVGLVVPLAEDRVDNMLALNPALRFVSMINPNIDWKPAVSSIENDWFSGGYQAVAWLASQGVKSALCVGKEPGLFHGAQAATGKSGEGFSLSQMLISPLDDCLEAVSAILRLKPGALISSDDRLAAKLLRALSSQDRHYADSLAVVSHANVGEDILPSRAARLEVNGVQVGKTIISLLCMLLGQDDGQGGRYLMPLRFCMPGEHVDS